MPNLNHTRHSYSVTMRLHEASLNWTMGWKNWISIGKFNGHWTVRKHTYSDIIYLNTETRRLRTRKPFAIIEFRLSNEVRSCFFLSTHMIQIGSVCVCVYAYFSRVVCCVEGEKWHDLFFFLFISTNHSIRLIMRHSGVAHANLNDWKNKQICVQKCKNKTF